MNFFLFECRAQGYLVMLVYWGKAGNYYLPNETVDTRPPTRFRASKTMILVKLCAVSLAAAASPAMPAPTTTIDGFPVFPACSVVGVFLILFARVFRFKISSFTFLPDRLYLAMQDDRNDNSI